MPTPDLVAEICVGKKMMNKRFTALMTTLILSVFFSISASADVVEVDGIYYNLIEKAKLLILVTEFGIVTDVKLLQSSKVLPLILVTELGIVIDVKPLQPEKAPYLILVTGYFEAL